jgi:N-methylhydantoinase A
MVYFEETEDFVETPIYDGDKLGNGMTLTEPAVVEEQTTNVVVYPKHTLSASKCENYVMKTHAA